MSDVGGVHPRAHTELPAPAAATYASLPTGLGKIVDRSRIGLFPITAPVYAHAGRKAPEPIVTADGDRSLEVVPGSDR